MPGPAPNLGPFWTDRQCLALAAAVIVAAAAQLLGEARPSARRRTTTTALRIDPNTAPFEVIQALPLVGPTRARAWVQARSRGPFLSLVDLDDRIQGLGPTTCLAIDPFVRFETSDRPTGSSSRSSPAIASAP
jgi:DNA uptake protein ComE-like DNA-binding protein